MFRLLQQQRYPWAPGSFLLMVALLAILGRILPAPDNSGHFSGGTLTTELGIITLVAGLVVVVLALVRAPRVSPFARTPSTWLTSARLVRALARAAVPLGVGIALICQGTGRSLIIAHPCQASDPTCQVDPVGRVLLAAAQIFFFGGFAVGIFLRPFMLARVTRPGQRTLLWSVVVLEWVLLFAASYLANGLGQSGPQTFMQAIPTLLFVDATSIALIVGSILLFRHALAQAEEEVGGPIIRSDWLRVFWDAGSMKICLYGVALAMLGFGALLPFLPTSPLWMALIGLYLVLMLTAAIAPAPLPAELPALSAGTPNGATSIAKHA
jgi:hypothetical protein